MGGFSRWAGRRSKLGPGTAGGPSFADVAGAGGAVAELQELCDLLRAPERYAALRARPPKGALLVGPPGTGKTLLARATAGEAHAAFFSVSGAEFVESLVGVGAARIRDLFAKARAAAPAIVFIDELDAVGRKRGAGVGQGNDEREQTLNQLLVEMDGFDPGGGLIVLGATNRPDILDPALLRPGRFDRQITIDAPDAEGRASILMLYLKGRPCDPDVHPAEIARRCPGFTGAELENVVNEAALLSARTGGTSIGVHDLDEAIQRVVGGPRNETHVLGADELETIAIHEAAHAVVAAAHGDGAQLHQLSIVARGRRLGRATALMLDRDRTVLRRSDLERQLTVAMAGAAAERLAFGEVSTAVNDDLHIATQLARSMVTSFGMSSLGPVTIGEHSAEVFLGASLQELGSVGPGTLERIDAETRAIVEEAEERAAATLSTNWTVVEAIGRDLVEHETLTDAPLAAHLATVRATPPDDNGGVAAR
jgi:cell division protease FtsH